MPLMPVVYVSVLASMLLTSLAHAEQPVSSAVDCSITGIHYLDDVTLTRAERLALMEQAFFDSVNRYELCELSKPQTDAASSDGAASGHNASGVAAASQDMQGTESSVAEATSGPPEGYPLVDDSPPSASSIPASGGMRQGATPEDIPPAANDDVIAAQIRLAAETETDPEIQKKLWNEYRKYKGLETVE